MNIFNWFLKKTKASAAVPESPILNKVNQLKQLDSNYELFGSSSHEYEFNLPLTRKEFELVEKKYNCTFPAEYKDFITQIGNGGAGPFYGLFPMEIEDDNHGYCSWEEGHLISDLSQPFPFTEKWNLSNDFFQQEPDPDEDTPSDIEEKMWNDWYDRLQNDYWNVCHGAIPICHQGCGVRNLLIITGPEAGNIWSDFRMDYAGLEPVLTPDGKPMTFTQWYTSWLNEAINSRLKT